MQPANETSNGGASNNEDEDDINNNFILKLPDKPKSHYLADKSKDKEKQKENINTTGEKKSPRYTGQFYTK